MLTTARRLLWALLPLLLVLGACETKKSDSQKELEQRIEDQKPIDDATIQKYLQEKGITNFERTSTGLYIVRLNTVTSGKQPQLGKAVSVKYLGYRLTDGTRFESSIDNGSDCGCTSFTLGNVIQGWNEALPKLYEGQQALLLIPSHLAYGYQGSGRSGRIGPFTPLLFDVTIVRVVD